jgi:hypothetical protein
VPDPRFRVAVQPGDGIVARFGTAVMIADASRGLDSFTNVVLDELDAVSGVLGERLLWRVAALLSAGPDEAPAFGLLFATDSGYRVFLHGSARAVVNGEQQLTGSSALTWVDAAVTGPVRDIALTLVDEGDVMPDARSDLRGGTMSGVGLVLTPSGAHSAEPFPTQQPNFAAIAPVPIPLDKPALPDEPLQPDEPAVPDEPAQPDEPALPDEPPAQEVDPGPPTEAAHYPDPPTAVLTPVDEPDTHPTTDLSDEAKPTASLMSDDGTRTPLDRSYVFGREPQQDRAVQDGQAAPIRLSDPDQLISRVQAYLYVDGERVVIQDAKSANGTFIAAPGAADWVRLDENPADLPVGWSIRMGRRVFTHYGAGA